MASQRKQRALDCVFHLPGAQEETQLIHGERNQDCSGLWEQRLAGKSCVPARVFSDEDELESSRKREYQLRNFLNQLGLQASLDGHFLD